MAAEFFVDENDLALGKALAERHYGIVFPGHPDLPDVPRATQDDEWLRVVGEQRLCVITRDRRIPLPAGGEAPVGEQSRSRLCPDRASEVSQPSTALRSSRNTGPDSSTAREVRRLGPGCAP